MEDVSTVVLVTSSGKKASLIRAMQHAAGRMVPRFTVMAGDSDGCAISQYVADAFWQMPQTSEENTETILTGCKERGIRVILPTRDGELMFWARNRDRFQAEGITVLISPAESVSMCVDKLAFAEFCVSRGIPCAATDLDPDKLGPGLYVVKERYGAGARKIGLGLDRESALRHAATLTAPVFQHQLHGQEISIDAWLDGAHRVHGLVLRRRDVVANGESQITSTFRDEAIEGLASAALTKMKLRGPVVLQGFLDAQRQLKIIECNARFGGASTASIAVGLDLLYWSLLEANSDKCRPPRFCRFKNEVRQIKVTADIWEYGPRF